MLRPNRPPPQGSQMSRRRAAALALVGWYLMVPPSLADTSWICGNSFGAVLARDQFGWGGDCRIMAHTVDLDAPLRNWTETQPFETLAECQSELEKRSKLTSNLAEPILS